MTKESISHSGIVESVDGNMARVRIERLSACAGCHAKGLCSADKQNQTIAAYTDGNVEVGQTVTVEGRLSSGMQAVAIAFVIPMFLMMALLAAFIYSGASEGLSALVAIAGLMLYYVALIPFRGKLSRKFSFRIKP